MPSRNVMGTLFAELHLPPQWRVTHDAWYPLETYERVAIAWLHLVGAGRPDAFRELGIKPADWLIERHPSLLARRDARESVMRFLVMRQSFFDFAAAEVVGVSDTDLQLRLSHGLAKPRRPPRPGRRWASSAGSCRAAAPPRSSRGSPAPRGTQTHIRPSR